MKRELNRGNHGRFIDGAKPAMEKKGISFDSQLLHNAERFMEDFDLSSIGEAVRALVRLGMESIGFPHVDMEPEITRKIHAKLKEGQYAQNAQTVHAENSTAASIAVGNGNSSISADCDVTIGATPSKGRKSHKTARK